MCQQYQNIWFSRVTFLVIPTSFEPKTFIKVKYSFGLNLIFRSVDSFKILTINSGTISPFHRNNSKNKQKLGAIGSKPFLAITLLLVVVVLLLFLFLFLSSCLLKIFIECTDVVNNLSKTNDRLSVAITKAEFAVLRTACSVSSLLYDS